MPGKPNRGGKGYRRGKKATEVAKNDVPLAESSDHRYAVVIKRLGGKRVELNCSDSERRLGVIPGSFYKKVWLNPGDIVLVQVSDLKSTSKECFILYKYDITSAKNLRMKGLINFDVKDEDDDEKTNAIFEDEVGLSDNDDEVYNQMDKLGADTTVKNIEIVTNKPMTDKQKEKLSIRQIKKEKDIARQVLRDKQVTTQAPIDFDSI